MRPMEAGQKKLVSVVIPAYNAAQFIEDAVRSCFNQSYRPIEILVVNDGSTDSTLEVADTMSRSTPENVELRTIDVGENKGAANALNTGFSSAGGEQICWLSADDIFVDRSKIQKQVARMARTGAEWSYFRDFYSGPELHEAKLTKASYLPPLRFLDPLFVRSADLRLMMLLFKNPINGSSIMIARRCIEANGQFDLVTRNVDGDGDLWMRYSALKLKSTALKGAAVFYREHQTQTSKKKELMVYGTELTRMRMLLTLQKSGNLIRLAKKFTPYLLVVLASKRHLEKPLTSEFLFSYMLSHRKEFNRVLLRYVQKSLNNLRKHDTYKMIDQSKFKEDLKRYMESLTFKQFEEILTR